MYNDTLTITPKQRGMSWHIYLSWCRRPWCLGFPSAQCAFVHHCGPFPGSGSVGREASNGWLLFPVKRRSGEQTRQDLQVSRFRIFLNEDRLFLNMEITNTESHLWNSTRKKKSQKRNGLRGLDKVSKFEIILSSCIQNYREKQSSRRSKHVNQRGDSTF